jgi:hypothetical protein
MVGFLACILYYNIYIYIGPINTLIHSFTECHSKGIIHDPDDPIRLTCQREGQEIMGSLKFQ